MLSRMYSFSLSPIRADAGHPIHIRPSERSIYQTCVYIRCGARTQTWRHMPASSSLALAHTHTRALGRSRRTLARVHTTSC